MKRIPLSFSAAACALVLAAALTGCSKERISPPSPDTGKPFVVEVINNGDSRGAEITAVSAFNMVGIQGTSNKWMDNYLFSNPGNGWVAAGYENLYWPEGTDTHKFYATCDNSGAAPVITDGKFVYTVPPRSVSRKTCWSR